jgi:hypothetical protein
MADVQLCEWPVMIGRLEAQPLAGESARFGGYGRHSGREAAAATSSAAVVILRRFGQLPGGRAVTTCHPRGTRRSLPATFDPPGWCPRMTKAIRTAAVAAAVACAS